MLGNGRSVTLSRRRSEREAHANVYAATGLAYDFELSTDFGGAFAHTDEAEMSELRHVRIETMAVIGE